MSIVEEVEAYRRITQTARNQARAFAASRWASMSSWSDEAADELVRSVVPVVEAAERTTAAATVAYVGRITGRRLSIDLADVTGAAVRNGANPLEVYRRPVIEARAHYSKNKLVETAVDVGLRRLLGNVELDTQRAATMAARSAMTRAGVREYRRVTSAGSCPLCVAASDRVYFTADLLPIHTNCHCIVLPASRVPDALRPENRGDDRGLRINDHGEVGPVLEWDEVYPLAKGGSRRKLPAAKELLPEPQPLTFADEIAQLRDDYKALDGEWVAETASPYSAEEVAQLKELEADIKRQVSARYDALQKVALERAEESGGDYYSILDRLERTDWELAKLNSQLDRATAAVRIADNPVRGGTTTVAEARMDKVLEAGDKMLTRVQERVAEKLAAGPSPLRAEARAKLEAEVAKLEAKHQAATSAATDPVERAFFREHFDLDITLDEYFELPDPPSIDPDTLQKLMDRRFMRLRTREVVKAEQELLSARRALKAFDEQDDAAGLAWRDAAHEILAEVRPMGGTGSTYASPSTGKPLSRGRVKEALEQAAQSYPTEWLEAQAKRFPVLRGKKVKRGYFQRDTAYHEPEIALSESRYPALRAVDPDGMLDVATHEIGHSMEYALPDISRLEWVFLRRRIVAPDGTLEKRTRIYAKEYGYRDNFTNHYTGKTYDRQGRGLNTPDDAYELFTTGTQALFTGELKRFAMGRDGDKLDEDFLRFMLGVMSLV